MGAARRLGKKQTAVAGSKVDPVPALRWTSPGMPSFFLAERPLRVGRKNALERESAIVGKLERHLRWQHYAVYP